MYIFLEMDAVLNGLKGVRLMITMSSRQAYWHHIPVTKLYKGMGICILWRLQWVSSHPGRYIGSKKINEAPLAELQKHVSGIWKKINDGDSVTMVSVQIYKPTRCWA